MLQYLRDYQDGLYQGAFQSWLAGRLTEEQQAEGRGRWLACHDIVDLQLDSMRMFYGMPPWQPKEEKR